MQFKVFEALQNNQGLAERFDKLARNQRFLSVDNTSSSKSKSHLIIKSNQKYIFVECSWNLSTEMHEITACDYVVLFYFYAALKMVVIEQIPRGASDFHALSIYVITRSHSFLIIFCVNAYLFRHQLSRF